MKMLDAATLILTDIITFLDKYSSLLTAIATVVVAIATIYYAWQNSILTKRSRLSNKPNLDLELSHQLELVVKNVGKTSATNVLLKPHIMIKKQTKIVINDYLDDYQTEYLSENKTNKVLGFRTRLISLLKDNHVLKENYKELPTDHTDDGPVFEKFYYAEMEESFTAKITIMMQYESEVGDKFNAKVPYAVIFRKRLPLPYEEQYDTDDRFTTFVIHQKGKWKSKQH